MAGRKDVPTSNLFRSTDKDDVKVQSTFRRVMDYDNKRPQREELEIDSAELRKLYLSCEPHFTAPSTEGETLPKLVSPFINFVWRWDSLTRACTPIDDDSDGMRNAREDLTQIMTLVKKSPALEPYFKARDSMMANKTIRYEYLWTIFAPGTKVYSRPFLSDLQMFEVMTCNPPSDALGGVPKTFDVWCSAFDWDGSRFDKYEYQFTFNKFDTERAVDSLQIFPTTYFRDETGKQDDDKVRQELIQRGRDFCEMCLAEVAGVQREYKGKALTETTGLGRLTSSQVDDESVSAVSGVDEEDSVPSQSVDIKGRIIVDNGAYLRLDQQERTYDFPPLGKHLAYRCPDYECQCATCAAMPTVQWKLLQQSNRPVIQNQLFSEDEDRLLLCPPKVLGYALKDKIWAQFRVKDVKSIDQARDKHERRYFDEDLQLEEKYKKLLKAFVSTHQSSQKRNNSTEPTTQPSRSLDIIGGKGEGLAILLHGPPGVGKTLTAETVALATGRPLLVVTVAEIGIEAHKAESKLAQLFREATRWEAVLLIDEADVFLEERIRTADPNRNALVSVLLRCLEYYEGIIILTTNRIKSVDIAVQSRMNLAIQFEDLRPGQKENIYKTLLGKIDASEIDGRDNIYGQLHRLCKRMPTNGRQIRNIVSSAQALAKSESRKMDFNDLLAVHEMTVDFLESLKDLTQSTRSRNEAGEVR